MGIRYFFLWLLFSRALIAATCVISCAAICTARVTLLVNKKDGICVVHPLIHFLRHLLKRPREQMRQQHEHSEHPPCLPCGSTTGRLRGSLVLTIPRSDRVSTENGWKSVPLENVNCVNLNHFRLKRLNPIEHDLSLLRSHFPGISSNAWHPKRTARRDIFESPLQGAVLVIQRSWD